MTRLLRVLALLALVCAHDAATTWAAEDGEWVLDANNWQEGKDLLPDPVLKRLQNGEYWFKVAAVDPARFQKNFSQKFWDATKSNSGKFDLEAKQCGLRDKTTGKIPEFVTGFPFPDIDKGDPQVPARSRTTSTSRTSRAAGAAPPSR